MGSVVVARRLSSCGAQAQSLRGMWNPPGPGLEPVSPALAGRLLPTAPPGKSLVSDFIDLGPVPLFLDESGQWFINFVYPFREPAFSFIDLFCCFKKPSLFFFFS